MGDRGAVQDRGHNFGDKHCLTSLLVQKGVFAAFELFFPPELSTPDFERIYNCMSIANQICDTKVCDSVFVQRICYMIFEARLSSCLTAVNKLIHLVNRNLQVISLDLNQAQLFLRRVENRASKLSTLILTEAKILWKEMAAVPFSLHTARKVRQNMELQVQQTTMQKAGLGQNNSTPGGKSEYKHFTDDFFFPSGPGVNIADTYVDHLPAQYNSKLMNSIWGQYNRYSVHNFKKNTEGAAALAQTAGVNQGAPGLDRTPSANREVQLPSTIVGLWNDVIQSLGNKKHAQ